MEKTTVKYTIINPAKIRIKGMEAADIQGLRTILKNEGCVDSENMFSDKEKSVTLDKVQERLAKKNKTNKKASADVLVCIAKNKYLLAEAKFEVKNVKNIKTSEIQDKFKESKNIILSDDFTFEKEAFYILFKKNVLTDSALNCLRRMFLNTTKYSFITAIDFYNLFDFS